MSEAAVQSHPNITRLTGDNKPRRIVLAVGPSGSGKTYQMTTLVDAGWNVLRTDPERKAPSLNHVIDKFDFWKLNNIDFPADPIEAKRMRSQNGSDLLGAVDFLRTQDHPYDAFYFDSGMRYCRKLLQHLLVTTTNERGALDQRKAYMVFDRKVQALLDCIASIADPNSAKNPVHVIFTWGVEKGFDFEGKTSYVPIVGGTKVGPALPYYFDDVLHFRKENDGYFIYTQSTNAFDAKTSSTHILEPKIANPNLADIILKLQGEYHGG